MADRFWLAHYPAGVPADIDADRFRSIPDFLEQIFRRFADLPAFSNLGATLRYADVDRCSRDFAAFLQGLPGMERGERLAIMAPNLLQYPIALFGALRAGLTVVNVNPLYTPRELEHQLRDSGAKAIVIVENFAHTLQEVIRKTLVEHVITTEVADLLPKPKRWLVNFTVRRVKKMVPEWQIDGAIPLRAALQRGQRSPLSRVELGGDDLAFLQYTGGTTGVAKGAMLTHRNMIANLEQTGAWLAPALRDGAETIITPLPLYHIFSLTAMLSYMKWGGRFVLITNPRDVQGMIREMARWKFTLLTGVNTLFNGLLHATGFDRLDFSALRLVVGGGAPVLQSVAQRWHEVTGCRIVEAYGLTEASPGVSARVLDSDWDGSIGLPFPSTDVTIRNDAFEELPAWTGEGDRAGCTGEICVRGPQVMRGYWNNPGETASVLQQGWLKTGDVGFIGAVGRITITDRKKDVILVSGFNVYPNEVEGVVAAHPGVLECAVVGVPDAKSGEAVKVFIVRKDPALSAEAVIEHCRRALSPYKLPRLVEFRDLLPKNPIGKVLRRELRRPASA